MEAGRRFADHEFAKTSWRVRDFVWPRSSVATASSAFTCCNALILAGAGVGGGSLNYANTLYVPPDPFFNDKQWSHITDWRSELMPHYDQATRMLGVVKNPTFTDADRIMKDLADEMGVGDTFTPTPVGVFFGADGKKQPGQTVPDPFFGGVGPARTGCIECGECMTGCRHGAKNTLVKNYLALAETAGAQVIPMTTVTRFSQRGDGVTGGAHQAHRTADSPPRQDLHRQARHPGRRDLRDPDSALQDARRGPAAPFPEARCAGPYQLRVHRGRPDPQGRPRPGPDPRGGHHVVDPPHLRHPHRAVPLRQGSNAMGLLQTLMTDGAGPEGTDVPRWKQMLRSAIRHPWQSTKVFIPRRWSERAVIALVMQNLDNSITTFTKRGILGRRMTSKQGHGEPNPTWIPVANQATRRIAEKIDGIAAGSWGELFNIPMTAHSAVRRSGTAPRPA